MGKRINFPIGEHNRRPMVTTGGNPDAAVIIEPAKPKRKPGTPAKMVKVKPRKVKTIKFED